MIRPNPPFRPVTCPGPARPPIQRRRSADPQVDVLFGGPRYPQHAVQNAFEDVSEEVCPRRCRGCCGEERREARVPAGIELCEGLETDGPGRGGEERRDA